MYIFFYWKWAMQLLTSLLKDIYSTYTMLRPTLGLKRVVYPVKLPTPFLPAPDITRSSWYRPILPMSKFIIVNVCQSVLKCSKSMVKPIEVE